MVIIYHLKLMDNGDTELDISTDASDILLTGSVSSTGIADDRYVGRPLVDSRYYEIHGTSLLIRNL